MSVGKWHLGGPEKLNWDRVVECEGRDMAGEAVAMLRQRPKDRPFFFWVATTDPHRPLDADAVPHPYDPATVVVPPYLPDHPLIREELAQVLRRNHPLRHPRRTDPRRVGTPRACWIAP